MPIQSNIHDFNYAQALERSMGPIDMLTRGILKQTEDRRVRGNRLEDESRRRAEVLSDRQVAYDRQDELTEASNTRADNIRTGDREYATEVREGMRENRIEDNKNRSTRDYIFKSAERFGVPPIDENGNQRDASDVYEDTKKAANMARDMLSESMAEMGKNITQLGNQIVKQVNRDPSDLEAKRAIQALVSDPRIANLLTGPQREQLGQGVPINDIAAAMSKDGLFGGGKENAATLLSVYLEKLQEFSTPAKQIAIEQLSNQMDGLMAALQTARARHDGYVQSSPGFFDKMPEFAPASKGDSGSQGSALDSDGLINLDDPALGGGQDTSQAPPPPDPDPLVTNRPVEASTPFFDGVNTPADGLVVGGAARSLGRLSVDAERNATPVDFYGMSGQPAFPPSQPRNDAPPPLATNRVDALGLGSGRLGINVGNSPVPPAPARGGVSPGLEDAQTSQVAMKIFGTDSKELLEGAKARLIASGEASEQQVQEVMNLAATGDPTAVGRARQWFARFSGVTVPGGPHPVFGDQGHGPLGEPPAFSRQTPNLFQTR